MKSMQNVDIYPPYPSKRSSVPKWFRWKMRLLKWYQILNPFNYRIYLYNKVHHQGVHSGAKIAYDGKYFYLLQNDGTPFRCQVSMTIHDGVNKIARAKVVTNLNIEEIIKIDNGYSQTK